jgi:hypothetical protein
MSRQNKAILYYSKRCNHCADLITQIKNSEGEFVNTLDYICIDGNQRLPPFLKEVPTLLTPTHPNPLTGESAFMWIETQKRAYASQLRASATPVQQQQIVEPVQQNVQGSMATNMEGLDFYSPMEMGGFGDSFSYLNNDNPQAHCFSFIDETGNRQVKCVPTQQAPTQRQQQSGPHAPGGMTVPTWLQPQSVSRSANNSSQQNLSYNANVTPCSSQPNNMSMDTNGRGMSMPRSIPNFQDPQRAPMNENNKITDTDYEKYMNMRQNDVQHAPQRI